MAAYNLKNITVLSILGVGSFTKNIASLLVDNYSKVVVVRILNTTEGRVTCTAYEQKKIIWNFSIPFRFPKNYYIALITLPLTLTIQYLSIIIVSLLALNKVKDKYNICIGEFYTAFLCGYFLKKLLLVDKLVYWAIDWFPEKSKKETTLLSYAGIRAHPYLDLFCVKRADAVWNFSERIISARHNRWKNKDLEKIKESIITPPLRLRNFNNSLNPNKKSIGFIGILKNEQGLKLAIEAVSYLKQKGINITLEIIGPGERGHLDKYAKMMGIKENVVFHGFIKDEKEIESIFSRCICGLALFDYSKKNYSYYTWSSKVGFYLECMLPVVATGCISFADDFENNGLGIIVKPSVEDVAEAIIKLSNSNLSNGRLVNYVLSKSGEDIITGLNTILRNE